MNILLLHSAITLIITVLRMFDFPFFPLLSLFSLAMMSNISFIAILINKYGKLSEMTCLISAFLLWVAYSLWATVDTLSTFCPSCYLGYFNGFLRAYSVILLYAVGIYGISSYWTKVRTEFTGRLALISLSFIMLVCIISYFSFYYRLKFESGNQTELIALSLPSLLLGLGIVLKLTLPKLQRFPIISIFSVASISLYLILSPYLLL